MKSVIPFLILLSIASGVFAQSDAGVIDLSEFSDGTVGTHIVYFQEHGQPLTLDQATQRFKQSPVKVGQSQSISLGIGVAPAWLKFSVFNPGNEAKEYRMAIETPWLDYIDTYLVHDSATIAHFPGGDGRAFGREPMPYRFYAFETAFPPGHTQVFIRVESLGPMAIPVRLSTLDAAASRDVASAYQYGVLYGIIGALALYNLFLFLIIRQREYGFYSFYLFGFLINSLSYTGHLHAWFVTDIDVHFQDWLDAFLMITYSVGGLHFARYLLNTGDYAPALNTLVYRVATYIPLAMIVTGILNQLVITLILAFILNSGFAILFVAMGVAALRNNIYYALPFFIASVTAAVCTGISTMAVAGIVPYNDVTFKLIEVGMAFEAIVLAVILARRFRLAQQDKLVAEKYARTDMLTGLRNRRGFSDGSAALWPGLERNGRDVSLILFDVDDFKQVNDQLGHDVGDRALKYIAQCLNNSARKGDVSARWGGEEFILLLPETNVREAAVLAERLRKTIADTPAWTQESSLNITVSIGVAGSQNGQFEGVEYSEMTVEKLIKQADEALYQAKAEGKNRVTVAALSSFQACT